ncbi:MAG: SAM-dependent DNA methyltransferase, partial [Intestinibacter sp.]|nr:SAM-dependent DNA methyltransferase [Intestinibacter sp.]
VERFNNLDGEVDRKRTEQSFFVDVDEIRENNYDLSINKYKEIEYEEVVYDAPEVILERVKKLEDEIVKGIGELEEMLRG